MNKSAIAILPFLITLPANLVAQPPKPPVPVEFLAGHDNLYFEMVVKKSFAPESRLGYFTVATFSAKYGNFSDADITMPVHLFYNTWKGIAPVFGGAANSVSGFSPYTGIQHTYASHQFLAVTVAAFYLKPDTDFKIFGLYEYKPPLNEHWSFYSRIQFIYNASLKDGVHNRSYLYLRAGLKKESMMFGFGANLDRYGPFKTFQDNYGPFIRWELN